VRSPNASARNSYYGGSPYIMMPMQHFSFNNSFSYGSEEKLYPDYYAYKWSDKNEIINKRIFEINYEMIEKDPRTTVMIKNIPNKYSLKLLSDEIDERHANTYDFLYLPFDFDVKPHLIQNNCNVGYAFINFLSLEYLKSFYESFNGKKWLKFRSVKVKNSNKCRFARSPMPGCRVGTVSLSTSTIPKCSIRRKRDTDQSSKRCPSFQRCLKISVAAN
jgi:hypothetical protein